jgi:hypothetical protein
MGFVEILSRNKEFEIYLKVLCAKGGWHRFKVIASLFDIFKYY